MNEWDPIAYLKGRHTKQLMNLREQIYAVNNECGDLPEAQHMTYNVGEKHEQRLVTLNQVKAELATREHVPNKQEAKRIRQDRAHTNRNPGR
jgi:hypothetical protein